tara:strand:+ start:865 stop:1365 length:501 start_codon:yes stop_codon:yes gene_type:complete
MLPRIRRGDDAYPLGHKPGWSKASQTTSDPKPKPAREFWGRGIAMSNTVKLIIAVIVIAGVIFFGMKMMDKGAAPEGMAPAAEEMAPADDATSEAAPVEEPTAMDNAADAASDAAEAVGDAASDAADAVGDAASDAADAVDEAGSDDMSKSNADEMSKDGAEEPAQ